MWPRFKIMLTKFSTLEYAPRYSRLAGELACYKPLLEQRIIENNAENAQWALRCRELVAKSEEFLSLNKIDEAWKAFHTAKRNEIAAMPDDERLAYAKTLVQEVDKVNLWRKESIISMLIPGSRKDGVTAAPSIKTLMTAAELKDGDYDNQYYRNRLARNLFWLLSGLLFMVIAGIVIYFALLTYGTGQLNPGMNITCYLTGVLLFGLLGALTSAILFTRTLSQSSRITELGSSQVITMSRIFIGAGFSIFIFLLLKSSVADNIKLFSFSISTPLDYFALAFISGFTEILAKKSIELLIGKDKQPGKNKNTKGDES